MKENDVQKVYWAAYEDGEVMESDDGILLISFDKETVEHYPSLPNQVLQVMICRPPTSRPVDAALKSPPECEIEETQEQKRLKWNIKVIPECLDAIERKEGRAREIAQIQFCVIHGDNIREICNAALPHCPDGSIKIPESVEEAEAMEKIGFAYIKQHAPHRLTELGLQRASSKIAAAEGK